MNIDLRKRTKAEVKVFYERTQDAELERLFPFTTKSLGQAYELYEESLKENAQSYGRTIYCDNTYIGDVWCYGIDLEDEKMAMVSIVIFDKLFWRKGIGEKALRQFSSEVFNIYKIEKLGAFTFAYNYGSIGTLRKCGFTEIERFTEDGIDSIYFELKK